jgi:hypothetical protein
MLAGLEKEVEAAVWPAVGGARASQHTFPPEPSLQHAEEFVRSVEIALTSRRRSVLSQPLELTTDPKTLHWNFDFATEFSKSWHNELAIEPTSKNHYAIIRPQFAAQPPPNSVCPPNANVTTLVYKRLIVRGDSLSGRDQTVLGR